MSRTKHSPTRESLPDQTPDASLPVSALSRELDAIFERFRDEPRRDDAAFVRYCRAIKRCIDADPEVAQSRFARSEMLLGRYVEKGLAQFRRGGRPEIASPTGIPLKGLLGYLRHEINRERGYLSYEDSMAARIPATEISKRCMREWGVDITPDQVRDALRR